MGPDGSPKRSIDGCHSEPAGSIFNGKSQRQEKRRDQQNQKYRQENRQNFQYRKQYRHWHSLPFQLFGAVVLRFFHLLRCRIAHFIVERRQIIQTSQTKYAQERIGHLKRHRLAGQIQTSRFFNQAFSKSFVTVDEESTPRTCSIKLRDTGWL